MPSVQLAQAQGPTVAPYAGKEPADFTSLARSLGQSDWPAPVVIGHFDNEGKGHGEIRCAYWAPAGGTHKG